MYGSELNRRTFLQWTPVSLSLAAGLLPGAGHALADARFARSGDSRLKPSLNAYSFNRALLDGKMHWNELLTFCAELNFDAVDFTAYYFAGYPQVPKDEELYRFKRQAFILGLAISGTGVRNDFTLADADARRREKELVKNWIVAAAKLGAPVLRIFTGKGVTPGFSREQVFQWVADDIIECADVAATYGIMLAIQNHADLLQTAEDVHLIMNKVRHPWVGLMSDIGSFRGHDPLQEIKDTIGYAITWQIKEKMRINGQEQETDIPRIIDIIRQSDYRGYLPIETLGEGDPKVKVKRLFDKVKKELKK